MWQSLKITQLDQAPSTIGIYAFKQNQEIIYIGKSVNIKARLLSHLESVKNDNKERAIIETATQVDYIVTDSEFKALVFEAKLINQHQPKYNVIWKDDRSYIYAKISIKDYYPKISLVRKENDGKSLYFGPFNSTRALELILKEIRRVVPYCSQKKIGKKPCFYFKLGYCSPCPSDIERQSDNSKKKILRKLYLKNIKQIVAILDGRVEPIISKLNKQMMRFAKNREYEEAIIVRNKIWHFERLVYQRHYDEGVFVASLNNPRKSLSGLISILNTVGYQPTRLSRIECYDVSNLGQKEATASMVVYQDNLIDKSKYRRFRIKNLKLQSDIDMLAEVLTRRLSDKKLISPDIIMIDGGRPQVMTVLPIVKKFNPKIILIGIAKRPDRLVFGLPGLPTIKPDQENWGFRLMVALRDEAHRFARKYHLLLRDKKMMI